MARILTEESSLTKKRKALEKETRTLSNLLKVEAGVALLLLIVGAVVYVLRQSDTVFWFGVAVGVFYVAHHLRIRQNSREEKIVQAGLRGETEVTRKLNESLDNAHYIFNDLTVKAGRKSAQIDHLVVSPKGIFVIETKNWRGHIEGAADDERWTQTKFPNDPPIKVYNPIRQTRRHVEFIRGALEREGIKWPDVYPIVVFLSPRTTFAVSDSDIPVLRPDGAVEYVSNYPSQRTYSDDEITAVINHLMRFA